MITMRDIAVRAGVSRSTVSFVLNKKHQAVGISEATRRRVLGAASEMGYRRNELARAVVTGKNPVLCFLVPSLEMEVAARLLSGVMEEAELCQHSVKVIRLQGGVAAETDRAIIEKCVELRPVGVMAVYIYDDRLAYLHEEMARYHIPVAVLDSSFPQTRGSRILSDDADGCRQAVTHLIHLGHRRIAFIAGQPTTGASVVREAAFRHVMQDRGLPLPAHYIETGFWKADKIEEAIRRLFDARIPVEETPTAVFCADDKTGLVVCRTLRRLGKQVPDDVSVIGFANLNMAEFADPPLTTVAQPFHEMGRAAVRRLLVAAQAMETNHEEEPCEELLPTQLIVRESTAPLFAP